MENTPWVPQQDGTYLPSAELIKAVRENPEKFPNAVEDFSILSGKSQEEVQAIIDNPHQTWTGWLTGGAAFGSSVRNVSEGLASAGAVVADKLGFDDAAETIRDIGAQIDPKFDTEKGVMESVEEVAGQAAPAVGAAIATGPLGVGGIIAGAGTASLTFEDQDNLIQMADELSGGYMPDFLVITEEDDIDTSALKGAAANLITDVALAGVGNGVAKLYRIFKEVPGGAADMDTLKKLADESGVELRVPATPEEAQSAVRAAEGALEEASNGVRGAAKITEEESERIAKGSARDSNAAEIAFRETGRAAPAELPEDVVLKFHRETIGAIEQKIARNIETEGARARYMDYKDVERPEFVKASNEILTALTERRYNDIVKMLEDVKIGHSTHNTLFHNAALKAVLGSIEDRFDEIVKAIRANPKLKTREAWKTYTDDLFVAKAKLASMYREVGSGLSYGLLDRKGLQLGDDFITALKEMEGKIAEAGKKAGYTLFSSKSEFIEAEMKRLGDLGYDPVQALEGLDDVFAEFDKVRQGTLANMNQNRLAKMNKAQRQQLEATWLRMVNDLHSSALLGQPSTFGLEVMSNTINNVVLPALNVIGARTPKEALKGFGRAGREYAGYATSWGHSWETFKRAYKTGKSVTDDFDISDAAHASKLDYPTAWDEGKFMKYALIRLWKFAADLSIAASEAQKAMRGFGVGYADGYDMAIKQGMTKPQAKAQARKYAESLFDADGSFANVATKLDVQRSSWQSVFDTRYSSGTALQVIDNARNSTNPIVNITARSAMPFFRTLVNIAGDSAQYVMPPASVVRVASKLPGGKKFAQSARFIDDFNGTNGVAAQVRAQGRQRAGMALIGTALAGANAGLWEITGPGGYQSWNAKLAKMETKPGSSLIIGDTSIDLTRLLPFSAPFLMAGILRDMQIEQENQMVDGEFVGDMGLMDKATNYLPAMGLFMFYLLSDAAAFRGMGELTEDVYKLIEKPEEAPTFIYRRAEAYAKQFAPGALKTVGKNYREFTGEDAETFRGVGFLEKVISSMGFPSGYKRLDFLGRPVIDRGRGLDPLNMRPSRLNSDPLSAEYAHLNQVTDLSWVLPTPDRVFDKAEWSRFGYNQDGLSWLTGKQPMNLDDMKVKDGRNAYDAYRDIVYNGRATKDIQKTTSGAGDRISIGSILVQKGESLQDTLERHVYSEEYKSMTPRAKEKVWKAIHGVFKKAAKDYVKDNLVVPDGFLQGGRYGKLVEGDASINELQETGKQIIPGIQMSKGDPIARVFQIQ